MTTLFVIASDRLWVTKAHSQAISFHGFLINTKPLRNEVDSVERSFAITLPLFKLTLPSRHSFTHFPLRKERLVAIK